MTSSLHKTPMGQGLTRMVGMGLAGILVAMAMVPMAGRLRYGVRGFKNT